MDNSEAALDSSELSENSECLSSNISLQSGVSGIGEYQGEFLELRQLINSESSPTGIVKNTSITSWYETHIKNLNTQLQNSLQLNEKYKQDLYNLEKKNDIIYNEKIEKLLKQNSQLEGNLLAANNQIQRLINIHSIKRGRAETAVLENKILQLEKCNHDLTNQNYLLSNEINQCNYQKSEVEVKYSNLVTEVNEIKLELSAKVHCIDELKKKIQEQHVQVKDVSQNNVKLSHSLDLISSELECIKKSEQWYKEELYKIQKHKTTLSEKIFENDKNSVLQSEKIQHLTLELNNWKRICNEFQTAAIKEKERALKQSEILNNQTKTVEVVDSYDASSEIERITNYYETVNNDLIKDIAKLKLDIGNQNESFEVLSKENSELLSKYLSLQNCLREKEDTIEQLENGKKDLKAKLSAVMDKQMEQSSKLLHVYKNCSSLEIEVSLKNQQKEKLEETVKAIREQFQIFKRDYNNLKDALSKKNKEILELQCEKQELYMKKYTLEVERCTNFDKIKKDLEFKNQSYFQEIEILNERIIQLQTNIDEVQKDYSEEKPLIDLLSELQQKKNVFKEGSSQNLPQSQSDSLVAKEENITNLAVPNNTSFVSLENVVELLESICTTCKISDDEYIKFSQNYTSSVANSNQSDCIKILLNQIDTRLRFIEYKIASKNTSITDLMKKLNRLRENIKNRMEELRHKCKILQETNEQNTKMLTLLQQNDSKSCNQDQEIMHLRDQLQVKIREEKEKQKRYEKNYRILLRKVKEHMTGRNRAEKQNKYLQELHDKLSGERDTLRLQLDCKDSEMKDLHSRIENYSSLNEKLNLKLLNLEKELVNCSSCTKCAEFDVLMKRLEDSLKNSKDYEIVSNNELKTKSELIEMLQKEKQHTLERISDLNTRHNDSVNKMEKLVENNKELITKLSECENVLSQEKSANEDLRNHIMKIENNITEIRTEKDQLSKKFQNIMEENLYVMKETEHLNSCLHEKSEEVNELQLLKEQSECKFAKKEANMLNLITGLKKQLHVFENEVYVIRNEKFFLQRLCNDLKVALQIYVNHNKALKEYADRICKEREEFDGVPAFLTDFSDFPSPKNSDVYVEKLVQESKAPLGDILECFNTLKSEVVDLQNQILEKNIS